MTEQCWWLTLWYSAVSLFRTGDATPIVGHDYGEPERHVGVTVELLTCRRCGKVSVGWWR